MVSGPKTRNFDFCACLRFSSLKLISGLNVKREGFRAIDNILGQVDPRIARKWHKPVQNAILWGKKMQNWKIMLNFRLFAVKSMKFSLTRFSKIQVYNINQKETMISGKVDKISNV